MLPEKFAGGFPEIAPLGLSVSHDGSATLPVARLHV
jgi:hypothetical protein